MLDLHQFLIFWCLCSVLNIVVYYKAPVFLYDNMIIKLHVQHHLNFTQGRFSRLEEDSEARSILKFVIISADIVST